MGRTRGDGRETHLHYSCATIREGEEVEKVDFEGGKEAEENRISFVGNYASIRTTDLRERFPIEEYSLQSWRDT